MTTLLIGMTVGGAQADATDLARLTTGPEAHRTPETVPILSEGRHDGDLTYLRAHMQP